MLGHDGGAEGDGASVIVSAGFAYEAQQVLSRRLAVFTVGATSIPGF